MRRRPHSLLFKGGSRRGLSYSIILYSIVWLSGMALNKDNRGSTVYIQLSFHDCFNYLSNDVLLIRGVAARSGRLFSIGTRKLLVVRSREVPWSFLRGIVVSIWTRVLGYFVLFGGGR